jgi:hypothetical protein
MIQVPGDSDRAPDAIEPVRGWRVWDVVELDGAVRLCSLAFWSIWVPGREAEATCRRALVDTAIPPHGAPGPGCSCGIYGTRAVHAALDYSRQMGRRGDTIHRVAGQVALWGTVVEGSEGWRASHGYPAAIYVPAVRLRRRMGARKLAAALPVEAVAIGLADYGVPVEILDASTERELAALLEPRDAAT